MSVAVGLVSCAVSAVSFGSMFVAVKCCGDPGDGIVVQWMICSAIFASGLVTFLCTGMPQFQPFAMFGGFIWAVGNLTAVPVIKTIGMGLGTLIWGSVNCVVGWATGRFGLFGTKASVPASPALNYVGLLFVIIGGVLFALIPPKTQQQIQRQSEAAAEAEEHREHLLQNDQLEDNGAAAEDGHSDGESVTQTHNRQANNSTPLNQRIM